MQIRGQLQRGDRVEGAAGSRVRVMEWAMSWLFYLECGWLAGSVLATFLTVRRIRERRAA